MPRARRCVVSLLICAAVFVVINGIYNSYEYAGLSRCCADFIADYGVPFAYFLAGGFGGIHSVNWPGAFDDALVVVACSCALALGWNQVVRRRKETL